MVTWASNNGREECRERYCSSHEGAQGGAQDSARARTGLVGGRGICSPGGPSKKRDSLGSGELPTWGGRQECRGATPKSSCRWRSSQHSSRPHQTRGLERGPQSGGRVNSWLCHLLVVGPWRTHLHALCLNSFSVKWDNILSIPHGLGTLQELCVWCIQSRA